MGGSSIFGGGVGGTKKQCIGGIVWKGGQFAGSMVQN